MEYEPDAELLQMATSDVPEAILLLADGYEAAHRYQDAIDWYETARDFGYKTEYAIEHIAFCTRALEQQNAQKPAAKAV